MSDPLLQAISEFMDAVEVRLKAMRAEILNEALAELRAAIPAAIPGPKGDPGEPGRPGERGKDGAGSPGPVGLTGQTGPDGENGKDGLPGRDGREGRDGIASVDEIRAIAEGAVDERLEAEVQKRVKEVVDSIPTLQYKGVYVEGTEYRTGDCATWAGSLWHANEPTTAKPGDGSKAWTLAVKKGRDAK